MWGIIGQQRAVMALAAAVRLGQTSHAYLFVGPRGVGKHTLAKRLAQALNCLAPPEGRPCRECRQCRRIEEGIHADVQEVTVEAGRREVRIGQVRELERALALKPYEGRVRVAIIDPADAMNQEAQNAFLKTLEEPPPDVVLALVTAREEALLPTIRSRCQRLALGRVPLSDLVAALTERGVPPETARYLARLAQGRPGVAITLARDEALRERWERELERAARLPGLDLRERLALAEELAQSYPLRQGTAGEENGQGSSPGADEVSLALEMWQAWWRDVLLVQQGAPEAVLHSHRRQELERLARSVPPEEVVRFLSSLGTTRRYLEENVNARLALEVLLLEAPGEPR